MAPATTRNRDSQQVFRFVNDNIDAVQSRLGPLDQLELLCECGDPDCSRRIQITQAAYADIRSHPLRFLFASAHLVPQGEILVESQPGYLVVEAAPALVTAPLELPLDPVV
jgi:hypothetical protein